MPAAPVREPVGPPAEPGNKRRRALIGASAVIVLAVLAAVAVGLNVFGNDPEVTSSSTGASSGDTSSATDNLPADEQCTDEIMSNPRWVCLTSAVVADGKLTIAYRGDGGSFDMNDIHLHLYGSDGTDPPDSVMGRQVPENEQGQWYNAAPGSPAVLALDDERYQAAIGEADKVCARIADADQNLVEDENGTYLTGNCVPITRTESTTTPVTEQEGNGDEGGGGGGGGGGENTWPTTEEPTTEPPTDDPPTVDPPTDAPTVGEAPAEPGG